MIILHVLLALWLNQYQCHGLLSARAVLSLFLRFVPLFASYIPSIYSVNVMTSSVPPPPYAMFSHVRASTPLPLTSGFNSFSTINRTNAELNLSIIEQNGDQETFDKDSIAKALENQKVKIVEFTKKSEIFKTFFNVVNANTGRDTDFLQCKICKSLYTYKSGKGTAHLSRHTTKCSSESNQQKITDHVHVFVKPMINHKSRMALKAAEMCAVDMRPFSAIGGSGLVGMVQEAMDIAVESVSRGRLCASDLLPDRNTVKRKVISLSAGVKLRIAIIVAKKAKHGVAISTDMGKNKCDYLAVNIHYFDDNWCLTERVLSVEPFLQKKDAENIRAATNKILESFDIDLNTSQIIYVTDQGRNFIAAFKNESIACICHVLNTILKHTFDEKNLPLSIGISQVVIFALSHL